ncbi:MAG: N-(5'-phosphoribosyl)anthranilate isomerase [Gemmatimonadota bacterium]
MTTVGLVTTPRVKICGIRDVADGVAAVDAGADYIGVVFAERVRRVGADVAAGVIRAVDGRAKGVGVFVDEDENDLLGLWSVVGFDIAQLHGSEAPDACDRLRVRGLEVWKAIRPRTPEEMTVGLARYCGAVDAILIEGFSAEAAGGTGTSFPYAWFEDVDRRAVPDIILAGGLTPANVAEAIAGVSPDIVDVSSGVESAPGVKSLAKIEAFISAVRAGEGGSE